MINLSILIQMGWLHALPWYLQAGIALVLLLFVLKNNLRISLYTRW